MVEKKEKSPFILEFKNNYGTTNSVVPTTSNSPSASHPSTIYCLHGHRHVELRGHCHRKRTEGVDTKARKKLIIASILCVIFIIAEVVGGVLSGSLAIATDAAHLLTDFASFMISLFAIWLAGRPSTKKMSFGWYRAEVIGALVSVFMIWVITAILVYMAVDRIRRQEYEVDGKIMLITSGLAILVNLIMGVQLHGFHGHSHGSSSGGGGHSHGHSHSKSKNKNSKKKQKQSQQSAIGNEDLTSNGNATNPPEITQIATVSSTDDHLIKQNETYSVNIGPEVENKMNDEQQEQENMNVRAAFIHVLGDILQSVGVFIAALIIYFREDFAIADPICTLLFSIIVLFTTISILKDALLVLMEGTPSYLDYAEVLEIFQKIDGVERVHNLRIWALSVSKVAVSVHLAIKPGCHPAKILQEANTAVHQKYNFFETTIQIEEVTPDMDDCQQCVVPAK
ncbi:proton-coupled zinc antiporter SLC30A2 [Condylostylus longicornis]|uniref:proton-coupled zinc antiporter SLC30A2 n=1 Tax=Condylostylus longicornis TaxID=2530218 RepID=UPI00244DCE77|nr:proton-coupled zinc antiporter SLC30A2 [Condylostylus longicornis]